MKFSQLCAEMRSFNNRHGIERKVCTKFTDDGKLIQMSGSVLIKESFFKPGLNLRPEQRTYVFDNYNKALTSSDSGYSIFAYCNIDGDGMRIENLEDEQVEDATIISIVE